MEYQIELARASRFQEEVKELVQEFRDKLKANGAEKIVAAVQEQMDAWIAGK